MRDASSAILVSFNLKKGMKTKELYAELHGKTAGENQRERAILFADWEKQPEINLHHWGWAKKKYAGDKTVTSTLPKAQVVMEYEDNFALILQYEYVAPGSLYDTGYSKFTTHEGRLIKKFFLAGINDEGLYFVRPLAGVPHNKLRDIKSLMAWLNKEDLGYVERVQGDIVMRIMPKNPKNLKYTHQRFDRYIGRFIGLAHMKYRLPKNGNNKGFTDWYKAGSFRLTSWQNFGDHSIIVKGRGHIVLPHATGFFAIEPLVVDARKFVMEHAEHGTVEIKVPKDHYAVLASQRGRDEITGHGVFD